MPTIDLSITITAIIGLAAIFSPIMTALINNHHQLKMRKIELQHEDMARREKYEREVYERYILAAGACMQVSGHEHLRNFGERSSVAQYYAPDSVRDKMQELDKMMYRGGDENQMDLLVQIITELRKAKEPAYTQHRQKSHKWCKRRPDREKSSS